MMQPSQVPPPLPPNGYGYTGAMFPAPHVGGWGGVVMVMVLVLVLVLVLALVLVVVVVAVVVVVVVSRSE